MDGILENMFFHDSTIQNLSYDGKTLIIEIPESYYEDTYNNLKISLDIEEYDIEFYYIKQYPIFHKVNLRGKEISIDSIKKMLKKGHMLEINETMFSKDCTQALFECEMVPYQKRPGVYKKIFIRLFDYSNVRIGKINEN